MKTICVPNLNKEGMGGGWTFMTNFRRAAERMGYSFTDMSGIDQADVVFIANPMWAERADLEKAKEKGKRIVMRLDNIPEDFNNRGTAISRLRDFIKAVDLVIYQSEWAQEKYIEFGVDKAGQVIHNGVDTDVYKPDGPKLSIDAKGPVVLYVKSSRNENKRYPEVMEIYRRLWARKGPRPLLLLVGKFADDIVRYNFGFYNGEDFRYLGVLDETGMAMAYRSAQVLLFPAYADCAPNVVLEAMASGCVPVIHPYGGGKEFLGKGTPGAPNYRYGINLNNYGLRPDLAIDDALQLPNFWVSEGAKRFPIQEMVSKYLEVLDV